MRCKTRDTLVVVILEIICIKDLVALHFGNTSELYEAIQVVVLSIIESNTNLKNSKEIKERSKANGDDGEGLYVRGRTDRMDSRQSRRKSRSKSRGGRLKCYTCQSEDHLKTNCSKSNRKKSTGYFKKDEQPSSNGSTYDDSKVMMVMSIQASALLDLIMDSGCSYHMTPRLDILFDFLECDGGSVQLGDNRECKIRGIGKVRLQLKDGSSFVLHNVRYIPELKRNLISLGTLENEGYTIKMQSGKIKVINVSRVILSGIRRDNCVYSLDGHAMAGELNASVEEKDSLAQDFMGSVSGGIIGTVSGYFLLLLMIFPGGYGFISSGFKQKHLDKFREWKAIFEQLCIESGIARHLTVAGTPQQNGVAERMNRTLMDKVRSIEKKTPMEMWSGHPSDYGMLRIFGCVAYPHNKQGKLEPRAIKCVLLGYPEGVKGYRLYRLDGESPKIVTSRNVVFNESDKSVEELQVEVELQRFNNHTPEEDQIDQEDGDDEDAGDHETDQTPDLTDYQLARDRERRTRTKPLRFQDESNMAAYAFTAAEEEDTHEPLTYQEAVACEDSSKWKAAMEEEMDSLRKNKTWELVDHLAGQKLVSCIWQFKIKEGIEGVQKPRYKARLVARGFTQRACIDYNEVFSLVVRHTSIRVILALTACKDYKLEQLDKSLYGLKQSPRQWYRRFDEYMLSNGFKRSSYDSCVYYKSYAPGEYIYLLLYVDDMLIACKSKADIGSTKSLLKKEFDMKELEEAKKMLGMEIVRDQSRKIMRVSQSGYISKILNNFRIDNGKSVQMPLGGHFKLSLKDCPVRDCDVERMSKVPYANAVGSLMYLMVCTRPDIAYAVSVVSRYLANPGKNHWEAVKWILKYLRGTANVGLVYGTDRGNHVDVTGFVDSDYAKDPDKGSYLAKGLLEELGMVLNTVAVNCDNQGAIHLSRNHVFHERTKHINVRYHFIREVLEAKTVKVLKVGTEHNAADALTKVVPGRKLQHCLELLKVGVG
ncbi:retrotransposon protein, putative, ty1-copia subclass [Tanacetum coccineum]